jgi:DNA-directed RNA polymerase specialized sigma24 family protein
LSVTNPKNGGLSPFELLLLRLDSDRHHAGEKYETLRRILIKYFECNGLSPAEELADDTLDIVALRLSDTNIENVPAFARAVAKNIDRNARRKDARTVKLADLPLGGSFLSNGRNTEAEIHDRVDHERRMGCLEQCVLSLADDERRFFVAYHSIDPKSAQHRQKLAQGLGISYAALRTRASRLRDQVEKCVRKCLAAF